MNDSEKTKEQLMAELVDLRQQFAQLQAAEAELVRSKEIVQQTQQQLQDMFDHTPAAVYVKDMQGRFIFINRVVCERMELCADDILGKTLGESAPHVRSAPDGVWEPNEREVLASGKPTLFEELGRSTGRAYLATKFLLYDADGKPYALCNSSLDITQRKQMENALQQSFEHLQTLHEIDQAILQAQSPEEIAVGALQYIGRVVACSRASVATFDFVTGEGTLLAVRRKEQSRLIAGMKLPLYTFSIPDEMKQGKINVIDDIRTEAHLSSNLRILREEGLRASLSAPLIAQNQLIGAVYLGSDQPGVFTADHVEVVRKIADQIAIAVHQAHLYEQIQHHAEQLEIRVAERTAKLQRANEELRVLGRVKDEFVDNVSHELRTPITNLKLRHNLLEARPDKAAHYLAVMRRETERLEHIVDSLLYLSRLDQGRVAWNPVRVDLNRITSQLVQDRTAFAQNRELILTFNGTSPLPVVEADIALVEQALSILLTNSFNYTPAGGRVEVMTTARKTDRQQWVIISVSDTGLGIRPDEQDRLFERFFRGSAGRESGAPGTGLGLSIVQEIVTRHQGQIDVASEGVPGRGSTFNLWLPVAE
ncbi:MAG: PAS domain-containing protein [Anaerolineae bacterium]|nr:PAS domain-containing protein [Anaerolineae bacterium]